MATMGTAAPFGDPREVHAASRQNVYTLRGSVASTYEYTFRQGALVGIRPGDVRMIEVVLDGTARSDLEIVGVYDDELGKLDPILTLGSDGEALDSYGKSIRVKVRDGDLGNFDTASSGVNQINPDDVGKPCFAKNDNTLYLTNASGTLSFAGLVAAVSTDGKITLRNTFDIRQWWKLVSSSIDLINIGTSAATELTIASGAVVVTQSNHTIDTESDGASDSLDTITGMVADQLYIFSPASASRTVVLRDFSVGAGNIRTPFGQSISLAEDDDYALAISDGTDVTIIGFRTLSQTGGGAGVLIGDLTALTTTDKTSAVAAINEVRVPVAQILTSRTTTVGAKLVLAEGTNNGVNTATIAAPSTLASNVVVTLPEGDLDLSDVPILQAFDLTLVTGTATNTTTVTIATRSEVIVDPVGAITGSTNFACTHEVLASRVAGGPGVGVVVVNAKGIDGNIDADAAGVVRVKIFTPPV
jgi:hypothetical protein